MMRTLNYVIENFYKNVGTRDETESREIFDKIIAEIKRDRNGYKYKYNTKPLEDMLLQLKPGAIIKIPFEDDVICYKRTADKKISFLGGYQSSGEWDYPVSGLTSIIYRIRDEWRRRSRLAEFDFEK